MGAARARVFRGAGVGSGHAWPSGADAADPAIVCLGSRPALTPTAEPRLLSRPFKVLFQTCCFSCLLRVTKKDTQTHKYLQRVFLSRNNQEMSFHSRETLCSRVVAGVRPLQVLPCPQVAVPLRTCSVTRLRGPRATEPAAITPADSRVCWLSLPGRWDRPLPVALRLEHESGC